MRPFRWLALAAGVLIGHAWPLHAQATLTYDQVLQAARDRSPATRVARARVAEAEARLAGARVRLQDNPSLDVAAGPRSSGGLDVDIGIGQSFDQAGSRPARIAEAQAAIDRERAIADGVGREVLRHAAIAFVTMLQREREIAVLEAALAVTRDVLRSAERRYAVGDIAVLDVNVTRAAEARAASDLRSATAARLTAAGELAAILGMTPGQIAVAGDLRLTPAPSLDRLRGALAERPDFIALDAERREADAVVRLGEAHRRLRLGAGARYEREEGDHIVLGGLSITLPAFNAGQELRLAGGARARRAALELEASRAAAATRVEAAVASLAQQVAAVDALEQGALPQLEENELLARRSYEAGQISLADWLVLRRELLDTRRDHLEKLRDAAIARIELEAVSGVLR